MGEQLVISISREFGSGGHEIAAKLAERLDLVFYEMCIRDRKDGFLLFLYRKFRL